MHTISRGVIYYSHFGGMLDSLQPNPKMLPIGMEALHRPGEQRGYGYSMTENENLNEVRPIQKYFFWHTPDASMKIQILTDGMKKFFPYDPMTAKVRQMQNERKYSKDALSQAFMNLPNIAKTIDDAQRLMEKQGCVFVDNLPFAYTQDDLASIRKELHQLYPNEF